MRTDPELCTFGLELSENCGVPRGRIWNSDPNVGDLRQRPTDTSGTVSAPHWCSSAPPLNGSPLKEATSAHFISQLIPNWMDGSEVRTRSPSLSFPALQQREEPLLVRSAQVFRCQRFKTQHASEGSRETLLSLLLMLTLVAMVLLLLWRPFWFLVPKCRAVILMNR